MMDFDILKLNFWDGKYEVDDNKSEEEIFEDGIQIAIKRALRDFTDRTEKLKSDSENKSFGVEEKFKVLCGTKGEECNEPEEGSFVKRFIDYFSNDPIERQEDFDEWHKGMCNAFLDVIEGKYQDGLKYGKAQKIVNMTFKNAYCLKNPNNGKFHNSEEYYTFCHMPLDSITLEWFKRTQIWLKDYCKKNPSNCSCDFLCKYLPESWSKMEQADSGERYGYETIQRKIRNYLEVYAEKNVATKYLKGCTALRAEFFVWKYMQLELAAESVYNQLLSFEDLDSKEEKEKKAEYRNKSINEKLEKLKDMLKDEDIEKYKMQE